MKRYWGAIPIVAIVGLFALRAFLVTPPLDNLAVVASEPGDPAGTTAHAGSLAITAAPGGAFVGWNRAF